MAFLSVLQRTCLKSTNSLRTQLLWSFGSISFVSLGVVVFLACTAALFTGRTVKQSSEALMRGQVTDNLLTSSRLGSEQLGAYMVELEGTVQLIVEVVQDRIVGYPYPGWEEDAYVPFADVDTGTRRYPLNQPPPPMEWNITPNVNVGNVKEHSPERDSWLEVFPSITTATGVYFVQGACDPNEKDPAAQTYYPNCTEENNNFGTGGAVQPTATNKYLHEKSGDLSVFLKALWESVDDALTAGVYFHNEGAGSQVVFPGYFWPGLEHPRYTSNGCEWMSRTNPYTGRPFASDEAMARCHPKGTLVPQREYNPMERQWFQSIVSNPNDVVWFGPYRSFDHGAIILTVGKAIFDRRSGEFIGCVGVDISYHDLSTMMEGSVLNEDSELFLVKFDDGTLVTDSLHSNVLLSHRDTSLKVGDIGRIDTETFLSYQNAVDFNGTWSKAEAEEAFRTVVETSNGGVATAYPIPGIPDEFDPTYQPKFLVIHSIDPAVFDVVEYINSSIDDDILRLCLLAGGLAILGMILVVSIVWCVSRKLTQPLLWMEGVAWRIVNHADECSGNGLKKVKEDDAPAATNSGWFSPKTEVNELVAEFQTMIKGFSGEGASKVASSALYEVLNDLTWHSDFQQLYSIQQRRSFRSSTVGSDTTTEDETISRADGPPGILQRPLRDKAKKGQEEAMSLIVPAPLKRNQNHVICTHSNVATAGSQDHSSDSIQIHRSPLFWWVFILIVIPSLFLICLTCAIVQDNIGTTIPSWVQQADEASHKLALDSLNLTAASKASVMSAVVFEAVRDLHMMTRIAGWLFFGGIKQSSSFTRMVTAAEECKVHPEGACPFYNSSLASCPCDWNDLVVENCTDFNATVSRNLEQQFWILQSQDSDPQTGDRWNSSSFPPVGNSPETTEWWSNASLLPGSQIGNQASGFDTSYDRLRVGSAMAVAKFPVYNYGNSLGWENRILGLFLGFEDDGLFTGFKGCRHTHANYPFWVSSESNGGAAIAPLLCPLGKYGYDPRCRDWYKSGRDEYLKSEVPFHITPPYKFAVDNNVATSATSPIANPRTGEYVGQVLLDFYPEGVKRGLEKLSSLQSDPITPILITPGVDATGGDTVIGPNVSSIGESTPIMELLFENDSPGSTYRTQFEQTCLAYMKNGSSGLKKFWRTTAEGTLEQLVISFAPVHERVLLPVSPDDFSRGVKVSKVLLYSVGIVRKAVGIHNPFHEVEGNIEGQLFRIRTVYVIVTVLVALLFTALTCMMAVYIVTPMITLLKAVQNINRRVEDHDFPPLEGGSREVHQVYNTFAKLYKVVRISNTAFFSGNLKWAYHFVSRALQLFREVHDQKAVGIACNNLGNTLFAVYYDAVEDIGLDECGEGSLIPVALHHYAEAIELAHHDFENTPESELKADFALMLADRLFNRGLFLLLIDGEELAPRDARQQAFADICHARDLDDDVKDYMLKHKLLYKNSEAHFSRLLRRVNGLADFYDDIGLQEVWDVKELIDDADQLLFAAWKEPSAPLFAKLSRVGQLQQLEAAAISLWLRTGNQIEAGRLAMRMFSEDEYILESSFARAADALLQVMRSDSEGMAFTNKTISCTREDFRRMVKSCKNVSLDIGKCLVFAVELSDKWDGDPIVEKINANCLALYDRHCSTNDYMGVVAYSTKETLSVDIGMKEGNAGRQRTLLDLATSATTEQATPAFPLAIQMVIDSEASLLNDSYVLLVLDGKAWDTEACSSFRIQVDRLNRERSTAIHLFVIGLGLEDDFPEAKQQCRQLSTVSKLSMYADATHDTIDAIFDAITTAIAGRALNNGFLKGVTMERF